MTVKQLRRNGWRLLGTVASESEADKEYEVKQSPDGTIGCACMGWAFRKHCRHLDAWQHSRGASGRVSLPAVVAAPSRSAARRAAIQRPQTAAAAATSPAQETFVVRRAISFGGI